MWRIGSKLFRNRGLDMTRFLFIADTHLGSGQDGFKVQPKYEEKLDEILAALKGWMAEHDPVDFILHGGDIIHEPTHESIQESVDRFQFDVPVHLCVGNHDLTINGSMEDWLKLAPQFFGDGSPNYAVETEDCVIHVMPNQYGDVPYFWDHVTEAHFLDEQIEAFEARVTANPEAQHLILTHSPVIGISRARTGFEKLFHAPAEGFTDCVIRLAEKHRIPCVLGAHSHVNMHEEQNGTHYVTVSSLVETPFEFKLFEVDEAGMKMTTLNLLERLDFRAVYNFDKVFAQGRLCDRAFEIDF